MKVVVRVGLGLEKNDGLASVRVRVRVREE